MTDISNIALPRHIAEEIANQQRQASVADAYVDSKDVVLDPSKLPESFVDRLPQPTGWRILILPYQGKKVSNGGIVLVDQTVERERLATVCGYVLRVGPLAYADPDKFGEGAEPWCKEGDWIIFGRYAGSRFKIEGGEVRLINDDEVLATVANPDDIVHV